MKFCPRCAAYKTHVLMLQAENDRLKRRNHKLKRRLAYILAYVEKVLSEANKVFAQQGGVPRAKWVYTKGAAEVARRVRSLVKRSG